MSCLTFQSVPVCNKYRQYRQKLFVTKQMGKKLSELRIIHLWQPQHRWRDVLKICHVFPDSVVFKELIYCSFFADSDVTGKKNWSFSCEFHKWMTPNLSGWMNLAVAQGSRDHDPGHPRIQNKELFSF